jgi:hypothetical protein
LGLADDHVCERCPEDAESATTVLSLKGYKPIYGFVTWASFMKSGDYYDAPISKVLQVTRSAGLIKG